MDHRLRATCLVVAVPSNCAIVQPNSLCGPLPVSCPLAAWQSAEACCFAVNAVAEEISTWDPDNKDISACRAGLLLRTTWVSRCCCCCGLARHFPSLGLASRPCCLACGAHRLTPRSPALTLVHRLSALNTRRSAEGALCGRVQRGGAAGAPHPRRRLLPTHCALLFAAGSLCVRLTALALCLFAGSAVVLLLLGPCFALRVHRPAVLVRVLWSSRGRTRSG